MSQPVGKDPTAEVEAVMDSVSAQEELVERLMVLRDAVEVMARLDPGEVRSQARNRRLGQLTHRLARAKTATPKQREELAAELLRTEEELRLAIVGAPIEAITATFVPGALSPVTVDRTARLLLQGADSSAAAQRLELIAASQLVQVDAHGVATLLPDDALSGRLDRLGFVRLAPVEVRRAALQFLADATVELRGLGDLEALHASSLPGRIAGYKHALRRDALDPAVLHSALELELELRATALRLAGGRATHRKAFELARAKAERAARLAVDEAAVPERARAINRATGLRRLLQVGLVRFYDGSEQRGSRLVPAALVIAMLLALLTWALWPTGDTRHELSGDELAALSDHLVQGTIVEGERGESFYGVVALEGWDALDADERRQHAAAVRGAFAARDVHHGVVRVERRLAFQFDEGTLTVPK